MEKVEQWMRDAASDICNKIKYGLAWQNDFAAIIASHAPQPTLLSERYDAPGAIRKALVGAVAPEREETGADLSDERARQEFEDWAANRHLHTRRDGPTYFDSVMNARWITWSACWQRCRELMEGKNGKS